MKIKGKFINNVFMYIYITALDGKDMVKVKVAKKRTVS